MDANVQGSTLRLPPVGPSMMRALFQKRLSVHPNDCEGALPPPVELATPASKGLRKRWAIILRDFLWRWLATGPAATRPRGRQQWKPALFINDTVLDDRPPRGPAAQSKLAGSREGLKVSKAQALLAASLQDSLAIPKGRGISSRCSARQRKSCKTRQSGVSAKGWPRA